MLSLNRQYLYLCQISCSYLIYINIAMVKFQLTPGSTAIILFFISGIVGTLAYKLMGSQIVSEGGHQRPFYHPYMQALTMTIGQLSCLAYYYWNIKTLRLPLQQGKTPHKFYYFFVPGFWDITLSIMQYMALNFISGSTFKLLQGGSIITTAIFSKLLLSMVIQRRHILGCTLAVIGLIIIGFSTLINENSSSSVDVSMQLLGIILMLSSLIFEGYKYAYEQRLMQRHTINEYQLVGWQGFLGLIIIVILSLSFTFIPCSFGEDLCVYDSNGDQFLERFDQFFIQVGNSWVLIILVVFGIMALFVSNASGTAIIKYFDALSRSLANMSKTVGVWIIGLIVTFSVEDPAYQLESKDALVNILKTIGFVFIIFGTLIYNKLILTSWAFIKDKEASEQKEWESRSNGKLLTDQYA